MYPFRRHYAILLYLSSLPALPYVCFAENFAPSPTPRESLNPLGGPELMDIVIFPKDSARVSFVDALIRDVVQDSSKIETVKSFFRPDFFHFECWKIQVDSESLERLKSQFKKDDVSRFEDGDSR